MFGCLKELKMLLILIHNIRIHKILEASHQNLFFKNFGARPSGIGIMINTQRLPQEHIFYAQIPERLKPAEMHPLHKLPPPLDILLQILLNHQVFNGHIVHRRIGQSRPLTRLRQLHIQHRIFQLTSHLKVIRVVS